MALRLLPAIVMDNDEDDDGNFTKWMSSYWGHGPGDGSSRERKRSFRRPARSKADRRASLPCMSQLDTLHLNRLHAAAVSPAPIHLAEVRPHPRAQRTSSDSLHPRAELSPHPRAQRTSSDSRQKPAVAESHISTIPELTESFGRRLHVHNNKNAMSLSAEDNLCVVHKEAARKVQQGRPRSGSATASTRERRRSVDERWTSGEGEGSLCEGQGACCPPRRQLSLRRHR